MNIKDFSKIGNGIDLYIGNNGKGRNKIMKKYTQEEFDDFEVIDGVRQCLSGDYL